ncbi:hypothetical protein [Xenorhabdus doucetiae]|uniref:hypothetical protein n=1 Tax=Xenorhabdus doucetiae TaxID=351671 RepID=UPI0011E7DAF2|nr:hypothetical protein [Xenorhabdus doucetiae]
MRYICAPLEADIANTRAMKVIYHLSASQTTCTSGARRENHSRQGREFSPSHRIFTSMENFLCLRIQHH